MKEVIHQSQDAKCVYVLAKKGCPSKNAQISWYFRNFNEVINPRDKKKAQEDDNCFEVLSVIQPDNIAERRGSLVLSSNTQVTFIHRKYSLVFVLHCNPSLATTGVVSNQTGVIFSSLCSSLRNVLKSLAKPFCVPGSTEQMCPEITFSILVFTSVSCCLMKQVLIHGCILSLETIDNIMLKIENDLRMLESNMAAAFEANVISMEQGLGHFRDADSPIDHIPAERMDSMSSHVGDRNANLISSEKVFILMLRQCLLTLKLLGQNTTTGIVILTDGTLGMPDSSSFDIMVQQLRCDNIAISFVQLKEAPSFFDGFENCFSGHVPNVEFMQFISTVTGGTYLSRVPRQVSTGELVLTAVHKGILCRDLFRCQKLNPGIFSNIESDATELGHSSCIEDWQVPLTIHHFNEFNMTASVMAFVSCRLKEGYLLRGINFTKGDGDETRMVVRLSYPWRYSVYIHYQIVSIWTGPHSRKQTHLSIHLEAPSRFISDMTLLPSQNFKCTYPRPTLKKCLAFLKNTQQTDKLLAHLRLFASNHNFFTVPDGLKSGKPLLLAHDPSQKEFVANPEVVNTNTSEFHHFWKQMATVDVSNWQKWFDVHTVEVLLEHDEPMSRHVVNNSLSLAKCKRAQEAFYQFLQKFTSFILVDKMTYVGIVYGSSDKVIPVAYYVLKVESRPLHFVVHVGFIGDRCFSKQVEVMNSLRMELSQVKIDQQSSVVSMGRSNIRKLPKMIPRPYGTSHPPMSGYQHFRGMKMGSSPEEGTSMGSPLPNSTPSTVALNCCHVLRKSIDKIQIVYDKVPQDFFRTELVATTDEKGVPLNATAMATNVMTSISSMLHHHRWVWSLKETDSSPSLVTTNVLDRILYNIVRLRLDEGFHFIGCSLGIIRMVAEFEMLMKSPKENEYETTCIVQFIIFPPTTLGRNDSHQSDASDAIHSHGGLSKEEGFHLIMECWVEPQEGVVYGDNPKIKNFIGLESHEIPQAIHNGDRKCISAFVTLEKFIHICQHPDASVPFSIESDKARTQPTSQHQHHFFLEPSHTMVHPSSSLSSSSPPSTNQIEHHIDHLPFPFDPIALTAKCQQVELTFSLFSEDRIDAPWNSPSVFPVLPPKSDAICPNSLLLFLFNEQLKGFHSKEFNLPAHDCLELIKSLKARERDFTVRPLPFCYSSESIAPGVKMARSNKDEESHMISMPPFSPSKGDSRNCSKDEVPKATNHESIANWKCYLRLIKSSNSTGGGGGSMSMHCQQNLVITIVPATYRDVLRLNQVELLSQSGMGDQLGTSSESGCRDHKGADSDHPTMKTTSRGYSLPDDVIIDGDVAQDVDEEMKKKEASVLIRQSSFDVSSKTCLEFGSTNSKPQPKRSIGQEGVTFATPGYDARSEITFIPEHPTSYWCGPVLPVYVYNCSTATFSDLLLNLRTTQKIPDLYEDLTFEDDFVSSHQKSSVLSQSPEKVTCLIGSSRKVSECESTSSRDKWRRVGEDLYKNQDDLKQHSTLVSETYLRCFVSAMYESLRSGQTISKRDINAAIYNICEESRPIEIDMTEFLRASCKQIQMAYDSSSLQCSSAAPSALFSDARDSETCAGESGPQPLTLNKLLENHLCDSQQTMHDVIKSRFHDIISPYFSPVSSHPECLFCCETTRHREALESLSLKANDEDSLSEAADKLISAVVEPSKGEESSINFVDAKHISGVAPCRGSNTTPSNSATVAISTASDDQYVAGAQVITTSLANSLSQQLHSAVKHHAAQSKIALISFSSSDSTELEDSARMMKAVERAKSCSPLFLHLTLSVRLGGKLFSTQIDSLPVCGANLKLCSHGVGEIPFDPTSFKVTLDIICLSLSVVDDLISLKDRSCYSRLTSINSSSQRSTQTGSSDCEDEYVHEEDDQGLKPVLVDASSDALDVGSFGSTERSKSSGSDNLVPTGTSLRVSESVRFDCDDFNQDEGRETRHYNLGHLPKSQRVLVLVCKHLIKWLLNDEIVSSLRSVFPVTEMNLERVTNHIRTSQGSHKMCLYNEVGLQFVFGSEKSLSLFIEQFEKMKIDQADKPKREKFQLIKSGSYYYLCKPYISEIPPDNIQDLTVALQNFHNSNQQNMAQNRSSSLESSGIQKSETAEGQPIADECTGVDAEQSSNDINNVTLLPADFTSKRQSDEAMASMAAVSAIDSSITTEVPLIGSDPNVQIMLNLKTDQHLKKMASIGGICNEEDDDGASKSPCQASKEMENHQLPNLNPESRRTKHFFLMNQRASTPSLPGFESRRLSYSALATIGSSHPNKSAVFASQTITTDDSPATPPALTSRAFVAVSSCGDRYLKMVEGFTLDAGDTKRVRPISGPAGLDGGAAGLGSMSLLAPSKLSEREGESMEDISATTVAATTSSSMLTSMAKVQLIKRAQSSTSFEKTYPSPVQSGRMTSQQTGTSQQPHRSRHTSGRDTPISAVDTSSITTGGYDADWSEIDDEGTLMTLDNLNPCSTVRRRLHVPDFWQILKVLEEKVLVFFHCREVKPPNSAMKCESVNREVINNINKICHLINQKLLLKDLWDTKVCDSLLINEADEDVRWSKDSKNYDDHHGNSKKKSSYYRHDYMSDSDDELVVHGHYLAASTQFNPGHFKCSDQFDKTFIIHPRLKGTSSKASSMSAAMSRLRNRLAPFIVTNRSNTYVLMDSTEAIFYACLSETTAEPLKTLIQPAIKASAEHDDIKLAAGHNSADLLSIRRMNKVDEEPKNSPNSGLSDLEPPSTPLPLSQPNLSSMMYAKPNLPKTRDTSHKITVTFYGICRPDKQITVELTGVMQKELDDAVLDSLALMFTRNPSIKLSIDDVQFIQRPKSNPTKQLKFHFPTSVILHQHAFGFYLRQNLQSFLIIPKYQDPNNPSGVFQPFRSQNEKQVPLAPPLSAEFTRTMSGPFGAQIPGSGLMPSAAISNNSTVIHSSSSSSLSSTNQQQGQIGGPITASVMSCNTPVVDQDILLYVRPQHDGNRGIACIHLAFVDGKGHPVQLLGSPRPNPSAYKEINDKSHYEALLQVNRYEPDLKHQNSKSPGPLCLIQFSIWVCGNIDLSTLSAMLEQSLCHSIQDFVFEYRLLTAPISEVPFHYTKGIDSPLHSAPVSPRFNVNNSNIWPPTLKSALPPEISRTAADLGMSDKATETLFFARNLPGERSTTVTFDCDAAYMEDDQPSGCKFVSEKSLEVDEDLIKKIQKYEEGSKGFLNPIFVKLLPHWFNLCCKSNTPSISRHQYMLVSFPSVELLLKKIPGMIMEQLGEVNVVFFREIPGSNSGSDPIYEPFEFGNDLMRAQSSFDENSNSAKPNRGSGAIYRDDSFIIVCRNVSQWRQSLDYRTSIVSQSACNKTTSIQSPAPTSKSSKINYKKFPAMDEDSRLRSDSSFSPFCLPEKMHVPRQFVVLITCRNKTITLYQYNLSSDIVGKLDQHMMRHVYWHNARSHVLSCIASQKMGLFQHTHYMEPPPEKFIKEQNPYLLTTSDFDQLISHPVIPASVVSQKMRNRSGSTALSKATTMVPLTTTVVANSILDQLYLGHKPSLPMHLNQSLLNRRDRLDRHGSQANQMRNEIRQEEARKERMQKLYNMCEGRNALSHQTLTMSPSDLELLKKSSRIIHQVMSPLLFSPIWQRESPLTTDSSFFIPTITSAKPNANSGDGASQFEKKRSRHSSGSSVRSKRSDSMEQTARKLGGTMLNQVSSVVGGNQPTTTSSGASLDQLVKHSNHAPLLHQSSLPMVHCQTPQTTKEFESEWHKKICHYMMKQYVSYLSPFYFYPLKVKEPSQQGTTSGNDRKRVLPAYNCDTTYMHKSLQGGIILVEVGFLTTHFYVTIFAFQAPASSINTQLSVIFTDECDKIKDAIHLNSFCHDFHLRLVQSFVQNDSPDTTILPPHYPVTRYLREVVSYFPYEPNYSWNYVHEENMFLQCGLNTPLQLFEYMYKHVTCMKPISMNPFMSEEDQPSLRVHALMCPLELTPDEYLRHNPKVSDLQTFEIGLLMAVDDTQEPSRRDSSGLHLKFWIVLTNRYQIYPKDSLEKKKLPTSSSPSSPSSQLHLSKQCANPSRVNSNLLEKFRREQMDYLGYSNIHQIPMYVVLQPVVNIAKERIERMASEMSKFCFRDHLWMRLLVSDEESKRKRKTGEIEESKDPAMAKLSCSELQTLLDLVQRVDLCEIDPRLQPILDLPIPTIQQLLNILLERFKNDSRYFNKSLDINSTRKHLIVLNPKALDICIMFTVEDPKRDADGRVLSHPPPQLSLVIREEMELKDDLKQIVRQHIENFVSVATYHLWAMTI